MFYKIQFQIIVHLITFIILPTSQSAASGKPNATTSSSTACNNFPELCSRSYANITHLGAHDSPFVTSSATSNTIISSSVNQNVNSTAQLNAGVRFLSAQVHNDNGAWHLCHSSCSLLDVGSLSSWLGEIKTWLDNHPDDVVTILLVNSDNASPSDLDSEFQSADIAKYTYTPTSSASPLSTWPNLSQLISNNTRLVTFVTPLTTTSTTAPYLLSEFSYIFENNYNVTSPTGFSCQPDRPTSLQSTSASSAVSQGYLPLMNHLLYTTIGLGIQSVDKSSINSTNSASSSVTGSLGSAVGSCNAAYATRKPWVVLVDFFDQGDTLAVVDGLNGVDSSKAVGRSSSSGSSGSSSGSGSGSGSSSSSSSSSSGSGSGRSTYSSGTVSLRVCIACLVAGWGVGMGMLV